jgi:hypothetical protein
MGAGGGDLLAVHGHRSGPQRPWSWPVPKGHQVIDLRLSCAPEDDCGLPSFIGAPGGRSCAATVHARAGSTSRPSGSCPRRAGSADARPGNLLPSVLQQPDPAAQTSERRCEEPSGAGGEGARWLIRTAAFGTWSSSGRKNTRRGCRDLLRPVLPGGPTGVKVAPQDARPQLSRIRRPGDRLGPAPTGRRQHRDAVDGDSAGHLKHARALPGAEPTKAAPPDRWNQTGGTAEKVGAVTAAREAGRRWPTGLERGRTHRR